MASRHRVPSIRRRRDPTDCMKYSDASEATPIITTRASGAFENVFPKMPRGWAPGPCGNFRLTVQAAGECRNSDDPATRQSLPRKFAAILDKTYSYRIAERTKVCPTRDLMTGSTSGSRRTAAVSYLRRLPATTEVEASRPCEQGVASGVTGRGPVRCDISHILPHRPPRFLVPGDGRRK